MAQDAEAQQNEAELEQQVRELVLSAAQILRTLGPERARVGWMLEDALMYLDEAVVLEETMKIATSNGSSVVEQLNKLANGSA